MAERAARLLIDAVGDRASQKVIDAMVNAVRKHDDEHLAFLGDVQSAIETRRWRAGKMTGEQNCPQGSHSAGTI